MRPIVTDRAAWSIGRSVCHTTVETAKRQKHPAKTAAPIEMPFGLRTRVRRRNHVLDEGPDPLLGRGNFEGESVVRCMIARDTLFDSRGGFSGSSYPMKT